VKPQQVSEEKKEISIEVSKLEGDDVVEAIPTLPVKKAEVKVEEAAPAKLEQKIEKQSSYDIESSTLEGEPEEAPKPKPAVKIEAPPVSLKVQKMQQKPKEEGIKFEIEETNGNIEALQQGAGVN